MMPIETSTVKITDSAGNELEGIVRLEITLAVDDVVRAQMDFMPGYLDLPCLTTWAPLYPREDHGSRRLRALINEHGERVEMASVSRLEFDDGSTLLLPEMVHVECGPEVDRANLERMIQIRAAVERAAGRPEPGREQKSYTVPRWLYWLAFGREVHPGAEMEMPDGRRFECVAYDDETATFVRVGSR